MSPLELNSLDWARRGQWPREIKIIVYILTLFLSFAFVYFVWVGPLRDVYAQKIAQETRLKAEFEKKYSESVNLNVYKKQLKEIEARFGQVLKELPTQNEMPALLEDISKTGVASGLTFELFAPAKEIEHPFYAELPVNITVVGTYHQIAVFLSRVAQISRVVTIHDFTLTSLKLNGQEKADKYSAEVEQLIMSVTIKIYRYRSS